MSNSHVTAQEVDILSQKAILAKETAYCPYSKFRVGACVLTENGEYITGANVENASYPVGLCAERCAISTAVAAGYKKFKAIAIATDIEPAASPCGMCRQFMREFFHSCLPVFLYDKNAKYIRTAMGQILPGSFGPEHLIEK